MGLRGKLEDGASRMNAVSKTHALKGLYAITDSRLIPDHQFSAKVAAALRGGARFVQYRD